MAIVSDSKYECAQTSTLVKVVEDATILRSLLCDIKSSDNTSSDVCISVIKTSFIK